MVSADDDHDDHPDLIVDYHVARVVGLSLPVSATPLASQIYVSGEPTGSGTTAA